MYKLQTRFSRRRISRALLESALANPEQRPQQANGMQSRQVLEAGMKVTYDPNVDVLSILLSDAPVEESNEDKPGVILDYDKNGCVVALEILCGKQIADCSWPTAKRRFAGAPENVCSTAAGRLTIGRRMESCPTRRHSRNQKSLADARGSVNS